MAGQLKSVGELLAETWEEYKVRGLPILGVMLLSSVLVLLAIVLSGITLVLLMGGLAPLMAQIESGRIPLPFLLPLMAVLFLAMSLCIFWGQSAVLAVTVDKDIGIIRALGVGWRRMWSLAWILLLAGGIVMTGSLLIVPGLIFSVWFAFAAFILYGEDRRGLDALFASRACVRGHFWNTLFKLFIIWLISILISLVPLVGQVLSFLFVPFVLLFMKAMYRDLKEQREDDAIRGSRVLWGGLAAIGIMLPALGLVGAAVSLAPQWSELVRQMRQGHTAMIQQHRNRPRRHVPAGRQEGRAVQRPLPVQPLPGQAVWRDPVGDVAAAGLSRWLDIRSVAAMGREDSLLIDVRLANPVVAFFNAAAASSNSFSPLMTLYLDTDVDRQTGGTAAGSSGRGGYDRAVEVVLEADPATAARGRVHVSTYRLEGRQRVSLGTLPEGGVSLNSHGIRLRLPYALLGLERGGRLRICYREYGQEQGGGLVKDSLITLP